MKDEKNNLKKSYEYTTENGESGSINPLYGVSCAKQEGGLITYGENSQLTNCTCHKTPYLQNDLCSQRDHVSNITVNHQVALTLPQNPMCRNVRGWINSPCGSTNLTLPYQVGLLLTTRKVKLTMYR